MVTLAELVEGMSGITISGKPSIDILGITYDSRQVKPGYLFICLQGAKVDGHAFAQQAVEQGAVALLVEKDIQHASATVIRVESVRHAMIEIAVKFYRYPSRQLRMIGVTGTNGKTTTTHLIRAILQYVHKKTGLIGTIHTLIGDRVLPVKNTTPDVIELQALLDDMVNEHLEYGVMEVSSHALAIGRVSGCEFDIGVFTNLTRDHLDFHQTFENYAKAKAELFTMLGRDNSKKGVRMAIVNVDDPAAKVMLEAATVPVLTYGIEREADICAKNINVTAQGTSFMAHTPPGNMLIELNLTGMFNVYNSLAAIGAAIAEGIPLSDIQEALKTFTAVPGRFELIQEEQNFAVVVDYAHTPDGLENVLKTARQITEGNLIVVFGCGGDRDRTKRPIMGRIAAEYGDYVVITSDNPRSEDPLSIMKEIERGLPQGQGDQQKPYVMLADRKQAIEHAIKQAKAGDFVMIAGKGHETYQILADKVIDFDDREVARSVLRR